MSKNVEILTRFPVVDEASVSELLDAEIKGCNKKIVVLDDDPTGVQTVHDVPVYTDWDEEQILQAFQEEGRMFFILTNSRSFTAKQTEAVHRQIASVVSNASQKTGMDYMIVCRGDSTLRGHYPLETNVLKEVYENESGNTVDGEILCPFFKEGGRFTIDNVHYAKYGEELIPVNETEFAQDKTFGYKAATLPAYVEEKTEGKFHAEDVICISLEEIRGMELNKIEEKLLGLSGFQKVVVNAVDYVDIKVFCIALYRAMGKGKKFMFRTAAAFVKILGGISDIPLLAREQMITQDSQNGGVIVIGSHTQKTTRQLESLKELQNVEFIELDVSCVNDDSAFANAVSECLKRENTCIQAGKSVCCYTTRRLITANTEDKEAHLRISVKISEAVQALVGNLEVTPSFVIAKGGITSSDVGTKALGVKRAVVLGQVKPGIPVWKTGQESKFPQIPYIIFPGNVGEDTTLREVIEVISGSHC